MMADRLAAEPSLQDELDDARAELGRARSALRELSKVGMALMSERDARRLFDLILTQARALTASDAGSLYLVENDEGVPVLHFLHSQNDTLPGLPSLTFKLPLDDRSIAGYVATTGEPLLLPDVYELPEELPFSFNKEVFDRRCGYRAKSMLVVPMVDHKDRVVGVLQLINRKIDLGATIRTEDDASRWVLPYTGREIDVVSSIAGQAAVSIENGRLYQDIENLFAGFIKAAVTAIDRRDPTTAGHSVRVTELTCDLASLIDARDEGPFANVRFSNEDMRQLRYAGLLHDFGKVGVPEEVLVKARKLPPVRRAQVEGRFALIRKTLEADAAVARAEAAAGEHGPRDPADRHPADRRAADRHAAVGARLAAIDARLAGQLDTLSRYWAAVQAADVPRLAGEEAMHVLEEIAGMTYVDAAGTERPYLTPQELHYLSIPQGNLDAEERRQIEAHVVHSYDFLLNIPWTEDALTASDRPYKEAMTVESALDVLRAGAEAGQLDADVVALFIESGVYRKVLERDWREF